jgi:hypothetical protein
MLRATVSGSFHRHMSAIYDAVGTLRAAGVDVLSPADPRVVANIGEFLFVASDRLRSIKLVQDRHLEAIKASDFLWVVCPDGYTGPSTSGEIMAAHVMGVPVYSVTPALDITIGQYVTLVPSIKSVVDRSQSVAVDRSVDHVLLDPMVSVGKSIACLDELSQALSGSVGDRGNDAERAFGSAKESVRTLFGF